MQILKKVFLLTAIILLVIPGTAGAYWEIEYSETLRNQMAKAGNPLPKRVGRYNTKHECKYAIEKAVSESGDPGLARHMSPVGYDEVDTSQRQPNNRRMRRENNTVIISGPNTPKPNNRRSRFERSKKQLEESDQQKRQEEFNQGKMKMLGQLKGSGNSSGLKFKGGETKLVLKSGNAPINNKKSDREVDIRKAKQRLKVLKTDVALMQSKLLFYQESLLKNVSTLDQQAEEITKRNSKLLDDGAEYFLSVASGRFLKLKSKSKFTKKMKKKYDDFLKVIDKYKEIKEKKKKIDWLINTPNDAKKLIDGAEMLAKDYLGNIAEKLYDTEDIPLLNHVIINYKAWTAVGKSCVNWIKIKDNTRRNEDYSMAIQDLSLQMQWAMEDINCLNKCMVETNDNCIKKCSR